MVRLLMRAVLTAMLVTGARGIAWAQADEIQVYDGGLASVGVFNLTVHNNVTPKGLKIPAFPGAVVADKSLNGVPEWAYGVTRWFEAGLYLPLYSRDKDMGWGLDGFKLRTLFAVPDGDNRRFVYGANMEFSFNNSRWDTTRFTSEVRPIIGWHFKSADLIFNPIVDTAYDGFKNLEFVPSTRVAVRLNPKWQIAAEHYADFGRVSRFLAPREQAHQIFGVVDTTAGTLDVEFGVGFGLTDASDTVTLKLILSGDFNKGRTAKARRVSP
jgi:hypothetical protein